LWKRAFRLEQRAEIITGGAVLNHPVRQHSLLTPIEKRIENTMSATITAVRPEITSAKDRDPKSVCRFTVIGAGPFGLSIAAHLRCAGIETRAFGDVMSFWRGHMPVGMKLRSSWEASHLSAPGGRYSLDEYVAAGGMKRAEPIPIEDFIRYGQWFQRQTVPDLDPRKVSRVERAGDRFRIVLEDGTAFHSQQVAIAAGLANQALFPPEFQGISRDFVSHAADHVDLARFKGQRVAVIGRGQSGTESAALLSEAGAEVELICRGPVHWLGREAGAGKGRKSAMRALLRGMRAPGGVGPFPLDWLAEVPGAVRLFPAALRKRLSERCLRPAAAGWLRPRMGGVRVNPGRSVTGARAQDGVLTLHLDDGTCSVVDHALLATGYMLDISKPGILAPGLLDRIQLHQGSGCPVLSAHFESSVPNLYFAGSSAVPSYGPKMRFVSGVGYAARSITQAALSRNS
jgi:hypothetical protein